MPFRDRRDAGRQLGARLANIGDCVVVGVPRGGVVVADEVARVLHAPLDVVAVRKVGAPSRPELALGAVGEDGTRVLNEEIIRDLALSDEQVEEGIARASVEARARGRMLRGEHAHTDWRDRAVVVVDDGLATGATARVAARVVRAQGASRVVVAAPVGAPGVAELLAEDADEVVCIETPPHLWAIGEWYDHFEQVDDEEVIQIMRAGRHSTVVRRSVEIPLKRVSLPGELALPIAATGIVIFAHGSGSSRLSPRNQMVARLLNEAGQATLLFDLLTPHEASDGTHTFDIPLLARRLTAATAWVSSQPEVRELPVAYFGASTGAAAALWAASALGDQIAAVVSRGGRPDLTMDRLHAVGAPTLLIVGERDDLILDLNHVAQNSLRCENALTVVPDATHLFEEQGALEQVAEHARVWFARAFARESVAPGATPS